MAKSAFDGVGLSELLLNPRDTIPDISEDIQQVFAMLMAFNQANKLFKLLRCDADGRLLVSNSDVETSIISPSVVSVSAANTLLMAENTNRRWLSVWNIGFGFLSIGTSSPVTYASGLKIPPFQRLYDDTYIGALYATNILGTAQVLIAQN